MTIQGILSGFGDPATGEFVAWMGRGDTYVMASLVEGVASSEVIGDSYEDAANIFLCRAIARCSPHWRSVKGARTSSTGCTEVEQYGEDVFSEWLSCRMVSRSVYDDAIWLSAELGRRGARCASGNSADWVDGVDVLVKKFHSATVGADWAAIDWRETVGAFLDTELDQGDVFVTANAGHKPSKG